MSIRGLSFVAVGVAMMTLLGIASCADAPSESVEVTVSRTSCAVTSYFDSATGCEYLRSDCGGITPRLSPGGSPLCRPLNPGVGVR